MKSKKPITLRQALLRWLASRTSKGWKKELNRFLDLPAGCFSYRSIDDRLMHECGKDCFLASANLSEIMGFIVQEAAAPYQSRHDTAGSAQKPLKAPAIPLDDR